MPVKILLLNENPVVTKLVTLSAQKTSDELDIITDIEDLKSQDYDLFAVDDTLYTQEIFDEVKKRVNFSKSLYICSRDADEVMGFTETLRKPFLPTDLVELFANLDRADDKNQEAKEEIGLQDALDGELVDFDIEEDTMDELNLDAGTELEGLDKLPSFKEDDKHDDLALYDLELDDLDLEEDDDLELGDLDDEEIVEEIQEKNESILDKDEVQEVQNLLQETEKDDDDESLDDLDLEEFDLDDEDLNLDDLEEDEDMSLGDLDGLEDFDFDEVKEETGDELDDGAQEEVLEEPTQDKAGEEEPQAKEEMGEFNLADLEDFEDEELQDDETDGLKEDEIEDEELQEDEIDDALDIEEAELNIDDISDEDLESTIEDAVLGLTQEDLESELDEDSLADMQMSDIDGLESLNARDIKLAIGEEVGEEFEDEPQEVEEFNEDDSTEPQRLEIPQELSSDDEGVESLKKLLKALSDKDVAASLKGMKININITLGDK